MKGITKKVKELLKISNKTEIIRSNLTSIRN
jgi:hypothetical protein